MSKGKRKTRRGKSQGGKQPTARPTQTPPLACPPSQPAPAQGGKGATTPPAPVLEHRFNDDLLISERDQELVKSDYSDVYHVFDHPELRAEFLRYDGIAK